MTILFLSLIAVAALFFGYLIGFKAGASQGFKEGQISHIRRLREKLDDEAKNVNNVICMDEFKRKQQAYRKILDKALQKS